MRWLVLISVAFLAWLFLVPIAISAGRRAAASFRGTWDEARTEAPVLSGTSTETIPSSTLEDDSQSNLQTPSEPNNSAINASGE